MAESIDLFRNVEIWQNLNPKLYFIDILGILGENMNNRKIKEKNIQTLIILSIWELMENHANYVVSKTHWSKWNKLDKGVFFWVKFVLLFMTHIYCLIDYTLIIIFWETTTWLMVIING